MGNPEFSLSCEHDPADSRYVVTVTGEIDVSTIPALREFLLALDGDIEVNCADVSFIDSEGIGVFVAAHRPSQERGHRLALRSVSGSCYRVFQLTGLTEYLDIEQAS
jgi:anti-sigma B factor antagonist